MTRIYSCCLPVVALAFLAGCMPPVYVETFIPPVEQVAGIRTLAVVSLTDELDRERCRVSHLVARSIADALGNSWLYSAVQYRADAGGFDDAAFDARGFLIGDEEKKLEEKFKVDALIMVRVEYADACFQRRPVFMSYGFRRHHPHGDVGLYFDDYDDFIVSGNLRARFRLSAAGKTVSEPAIPVQRFRERGDWCVSRDEIYAALAAGAARDFLPYIDVTAARRPRLLKTGGEGEIKRGVGAALDGDWCAAAAIWLETAKTFPGNFASFYNLAVVAEKERNFAEALSLFRKARELTGKPDAFAREISESSSSVKAEDAIKAAGRKFPKQRILPEKIAPQEKSAKEEKVVKPDSPAGAAKEEKLAPVPDKPDEKQPGKPEQGKPDEKTEKDDQRK